MKRTEMIEKMVACYRSCKIMKYSDTQAMDRVLEVCEENGMLPPAYRAHDPGQFPGDAFTYNTNEWEDTDET